MAAFESALLNPMLDWALGVANPPAIATRYITIFDGEPGNGGSEVINAITGSNNRQDCTAAMATSVGDVLTSDTDITFTNAATGDGDVDWVALYSAITGGSLLGKAQVGGKSISTGDSLKILAGFLTFGIS